jgi:hypothetical protein
MIKGVDLGKKALKESILQFDNSKEKEQAFTKIKDIINLVELYEKKVEINKKDKNLR